MLPMDKLPGLRYLKQDKRLYTQLFKYSIMQHRNLESNQNS